MITAKGKQLEWQPDLTVREVLREIGYDFASILVRVNNRIVPQEQWDTFLVPNDARLDVHQMVSGG